MRWKAPQTDVHGRSNGCTVKGYIIQCDGVATKQILQPLQTKVLAGNSLSPMMSDHS